MPSNHSISNNISLYPWYRSLTSAMAFLPIFFLFFNEIVSLREVLLLESVYYISVVCIEVPSGYFSDRIGRKKTLIISTIFFIISYLVFGFSYDFKTLAIAQVLLAAAISFRSGTDTSFYYESLADAGIEDEYGQREASVQSWIQITSALAVLAGGFLGAISLELPYYFSVVIVIPALIICFLFKEPGSNEKAGIPFFKQLGICFSYLKLPQLKWLFIFSVLMYAMTHIPYEFYQPYLQLLEDRGDLVFTNAPIASGVLFAGTRFVAAYAAKMSVTWTERFGIYKILFIAIIIQAIIIGLLGVMLSLFLVSVVLFRNFSMMLTRAPINAIIAPIVNSNQRATYFSIQSLAYRLSFATVLVVLALPFGSEHATDWPALSWMLRVSFVASIICTIALFIFIPKVKDSSNG